MALEAITFEAISNWYKKEFQMAGWVIISEDPTRLERYMHQLKHLHAHLFAKFQATRDHDKKVDLQIMIKKTEDLLKILRRL